MINDRIIHGLLVEFSVRQAFSPLSVNTILSRNCHPLLRKTAPTTVGLEPVTSGTPPTKECYLLMYSWEIGIERITGANRESDALRVKKGKFPPNHQEMDPVEVGRMGRGGCSSPSYLWFVSLFSLSSFPFPPFFCVAALQLLGCWLRDLKAPFHQQRKRRRTGQVPKVYSLEPQIHPDE